MPEGIVSRKKKRLASQRTFSTKNFNCQNIIAILLFLILQRYNKYLKSYSMITRTDPVIPSYNSLYKKHMVYLLVTATFEPLWM